MYPIPCSLQTCPQNVGATLTLRSLPSLNVLSELVDSLVPCVGIDVPDTFTGSGLMLIERPDRILSLAADMAGEAGTDPPRGRTFNLPISEPSAAA